MGIEQQPVNDVQWWSREKLYANDYNPNKVAPPEWALLKTSLLEDGWTIPLIIRPDGEIVDGFHRWTLSGDPDIYKLTDGLVPVVILPQALDRLHQMASTIRYNRARGSHYVVSMADMVAELKDKQRVEDKDIMRLFGMEDEEVRRLHERGKMTKRGSREGFGNGWVPEFEK